MSKTIAVLQPSYMPWLGFFDQMAKADIFVFYDDVQFDKHGWRNRNRVKSSSGEPAWITVPVLHSGKQKPLLKDIAISTDRPWAKKQIGTLQQYYGRAPHLKTYLEELREWLEHPYAGLAELNYRSIAWLGEKLGVKTETVRSSELGIGGDPSERLINICRHFGASHYLSGDKARDYLDVEAFRRAGLQVRWQHYQHPIYPQLHGEFIPYLSALDLLLNVGADARTYLAPQAEEATMPC